ncbi:hypothetical protein MKW98_012546 [Papaver atlanticum]|uniref:Uncharacterized protein n=1 Tax=Papaver atlanticum TaxID=357466 RepID=A0AAD4XPB8_9MAGN|nr:hypothetical protein MKW98_012546 [Papaver atlanticum]
MRKELVKMKIFARRSIYLEEMSVRSPKACDLDLKRREQAMTRQPVPALKDCCTLRSVGSYWSCFGVEYVLWLRVYFNDTVIEILLALELPCLLHFAGTALTTNRACITSVDA